MDSEALAGDEATIDMDYPYHRAIDVNVMQNYNNVKEYIVNFISNRIGDSVFRESEYGKAYYIVAKPYNKDYSESPDWYRSNKSMDYIRRFLKLKHYFSTLEEASKPHYNIIAFMKDEAIEKRHNTKTNYYKYHIVPLYTVNDIFNIEEYIIKESKYRNLKCKFTK